MNTFFKVMGIISLIVLAIMTLRMCGANGNPNVVYIGNNPYYTDEVLDDGGTYGESGNYLFWFDVQGNYHHRTALFC